jgi:predicted Zn-dependent protease
MTTDRLQQLRTMLAEEPGDTFLRYAIALELKRAGEMEAAVKALEELLHDEPKHVPSYYQLAIMLADLNRTNDAIHACEVGMLQCIVTGDRKARAELQELMRSLMPDMP